MSSSLFLKLLLIEGILYYFRLNGKVNDIVDNERKGYETRVDYESSLFLLIQSHKSSICCIGM